MIDDLADRLRDPAVVLWLDLDSPSQAELDAVAGQLGLHPLAVEAAAGHERPKVLHFGTHCVVTACGVRLDPVSGVLVTVGLTAFVTDRALITVHHNGITDIDALVERWDTTADLAKSGAGFLLHGLLDYLVDGHFDAAQALDEQIEALEDLVFAEDPDDTLLQRRSLTLRKSLNRLRHVVLPIREVVGSVLRRDLQGPQDPLLPYYQDVLDHVLRVSEWTESLREEIATIRETQLSLQGNRLNTIMKKVTSWAAIIAVPTAITGFYGQNLPYPGFAQTWGAWMSTVAIVVLSGVLYVLFKRRDWL